MSDVWTLYRLFDDRNALLYVGITSRGFGRIEEHARKKPWWRQVKSAKFSHHRTREAAHRAEVLAIRKEKPRHNSQHTGDSPDCPDDSVSDEPTARPTKWQPVKVCVAAEGFPDPNVTPTMPIWPDAALLMGYASRSAAYRAAENGYLPTVQLSEKRWVVPTAALLSVLGVATAAVPLDET